MSISSQTAVDSIAYPPTHTYILSGLKPTGTLEKRWAILDRVAPGFFEDAGRFLDIAANKGFFSLMAAKTCRNVTAVEPDVTCAALLRRLAPKNMTVLHGGLDTLKNSKPFDRIWIGNAHHYLFRDASGWSWVKRLAELCRGELLVEGPDGMGCSDMAACIPDHLQPMFTRAQWLGNLQTWFDVLSETPADSYTPGRFIWHCRKRESPAFFGERVLIPLYQEMSKYIMLSDVVLEVGVRDDRGKLSREMFQCARFIAADRDPERVSLAGGGDVLDVLVEPVPGADVVITTALIHHTGPAVIPLLIERLCKAAGRMLLVSGPDIRLQPHIYGDHRWHLDVSHLKALATENGFDCIDEQPIGTGDVYLAFRRSA